MAGPKGGAPRRSHTKSRGGCTECKKRHLRCDETFPQCTNCTKHRTRCPYNETDREQPDMLWTDQVSHEIDLWRQEGVFPFPNLVLESIPNPAEYTVEELRLIHYVLALYDGLTKNAVAGLTVWAQYIPHILSLGATHKHVMHALMSFSASNMANKTNCPLVGQLSLDCKGLAMAGIREAVLSGNPDDVCEAIAMTSLILSWRADDWSSWYTMMKGILEASRTIMHGPRPCRLEDFLSKEYDFLAMLPELSAADRRSRTPLPEALAEWKEAQTNAQKIMEQLKQRKKPTKLIKQLLDLLDGVGKVPSYRSADDQFHRLRNLRTWVFWTPATTLDGPEPPTADELVAIAYYYATAILAHSLCPEINTVQLANLSVDPIRRIGEIVNQLNIQHNGEYSLQVDQLRYPLTVMRAFLSRMNLEDGQSFHGSDDFIANVSPIPHFLGVPPSSGVPHSPSLSVPHAVTHNSPATPVFSVAASHSPVSVYTGFDVSPVTPVMSAFSQTTHGYESSPMTQTTHGYGSPFSPGYAAYIDSPVSGGAHSYTGSPMSNEHLGHSHQRSFDNSPLFSGFPDFGNSPITAGFPPIDTTPYLVNISGPGNSPQSPLFYDAGLAYSNPAPCDPLWNSYQSY